MVPCIWLGLMNYFLGIEVLQMEKGIFICQRRYTEEILRRFGMEDSNLVGNPIVPGTRIGRDDEGNGVDETHFKQLVGSLMYLTSTRPDIMFATSLISRFMSKPTELHMQAGKRILRYLKGTMQYGIYYQDNGRLNIYTDSDFAGDLEDRKSTSEYVAILSYGVVSWCSKKQPIVTLSTTEAEFVAATVCVCQAIWIRRLKHEVPLIAFSEDRCLTLFHHPLVDSLHTIYHEPKAEIIPSVEQLLASGHIQKLIFLDTAEGVTTTLRPFWAEATGKTASVVQAVPDMLEIVPSGTSKGNGVRMLLDHLSVTPKEIMAIGDGENDVEMLELAGLGIALSNGADKAKSVADVIGASNDEDGVVDAIYRYAF